ncbi:MAG: hypothetical protein ACTXOO_04705 [Sodalis sp. (in: enterobacteria)]
MFNQFMKFFVNANYRIHWVMGPPIHAQYVLQCRNKFGIGFWQYNSVVPHTRFQFFSGSLLFR